MRRSKSQMGEFLLFQLVDIVHSQSVGGMTVHNHPVFMVNRESCHVAHQMSRELGSELAAVPVAPQQFSCLAVGSNADDAQISFRITIHIFEILTGASDDEDLLRSKRIDNTWYWVCRKHEESKALCEMPPVPENEIKAAFQRLHYGIKHNTAVLDFYAKHLILVRNRQMLWSSDAIELNKEISDILDQSHTLSLLNRQGMVDPDIFISKNNQLAEQLRKAKQQKEKLHNLEHDQVIDQTRQLQETLLTGPEILDAFDEELFCELIDRITVQSNTQVRFRLKNGLELTESMERTVR